MNENKTTLIFGSDHGGFQLKSFLTTTMLQTTDYKILDVGCFTDTLKCDYPDYAKIVAEKVKNTPDSYGILVCGTGIGISIAANKVKNIRCALCYNIKTAQMAKRHNNANIIALGGRILQPETAKNILITFLKEEFEAGRHRKRIEKLKLMEKMFK